MTPLSIAKDGRITIGDAEAVRLVAGTPVIALADGTLLGVDTSIECSVHQNSLMIEWKNGLRLNLTIDSRPRGIEIMAALQNTGIESIAIAEVQLLSNARIESTVLLDRALINGEDMNTCSGYVDLATNRHSNSVIGLTDTAGTAALLLGYLDVRSSFCGFHVKTSDGRAESLSTHVAREGIAIAPGKVLSIPPLVIASGESLSELLQDYARESGAFMDARRTPRHTGWCSWYTYYGTETVDDVLANVESFRRSLFAPHLKTIQIDDGWNYVAPGAPRNWGDWNAGHKFPAGMKNTADRIKAAGFSPGLWLAPFSIDPGSNFFRDYPDLLVQDGAKPKLFWECYGLDLTNPRTIDYVRDTFDRVFNAWGFEYIKIDFLLHAIQPGRRHDDSLTTAEVLRKGLQAIRDIAGDDRFILTCGCPMGPAVGICDSMRIGLDVSHRWYLPMNLEAWPWGNCSIYSGARHVIGRQWMDRHWWQNDPDCLLVHDEGSAGEKKMFSGTGELGRFATQPPYGLSEEEATFWARLVWISGGLGMIGESIDNLKPERLAILQHAFPPNNAPAHVVDYYVDPEVSVLRAASPTPMIGLFNLSEEPHTVRIPRSRTGLGETTRLREWLTGETIEVEGETMEFPPLAPRSGRIWMAD